LTNPTRIAENFDGHDFELSAEELARFDELDTGIRGGPEPDTCTPMRCCGFACRPFPALDPIDSP
jgi:diketogulonate reductase-like aldo/keto reductase